MKKKDYSFYLNKEEREKKIMNYKIWFLISLPFFFLPLGALIFFTILIIFVFDNLIFQFKTKHYWCFVFTLGSSGFFALVFWFRWYLPYLKEELTEKEVMN